MRAAILLRLALAMLVVVSLAAGLAGGLLRAGQGLPAWAHGAWAPQALLAHAFLMISAFMGTVIAVERAVALKARWAYAVPLMSALAGAATLVGQARHGAMLACVAAALFVGVNVAVVRRQREAHTVLLLCSAGAWFVGSVLYAGGVSANAVTPWWFSFLVLTIAAERLEMTRLLPRRAHATCALHVALAGIVCGAAIGVVVPAAGQQVFGLALLAVAAWLLAFDIARRTISASGLSRYMAVCLLAGYAWLGVAGCAWMAVGAGMPARDAAVHALALGFVVSMMLAHAPVILPAVAGIRLAWTPLFYVPLAALHLSLAVRLFFPAMLRPGAIANAVAIILFIGTVAAAAALARRPRRPHRSRKIRHVTDPA